MCRFFQDLHEKETVGTYRTSPAYSYRASIGAFAVALLAKQAFGMRMTRATAARAATAAGRERKTLSRYFATTTRKTIPRTGGFAESSKSNSLRARSLNTNAKCCSKQEKKMVEYFPVVNVAQKRKIIWEKYFEQQMNSLKLYQSPAKHKCTKHDF